jgi:hypothetical protein
VETVLGAQTMKWSKNEYVRKIKRSLDPSYFHRLDYSRLIGALSFSAGSSSFDA